MSKKQGTYSISAVENFTEKKLEICVTNYRTGSTATIPASQAKKALKEFKKAVKQISTK